MSTPDPHTETDDEMWARRKALLNPTPDTDDQKSVRAHDPMAWLERKRAADERLV
jgi:hypothetical protein